MTYDINSIKERVTFLGEELELKGKIWRGSDGLAIDDCGLGSRRYRCLWGGRSTTGRSPQDASDSMEKELQEQFDSLAKRLGKKNPHDCRGCGHARELHKDVGSGGCTECSCLIHTVVGICWVIQAGDKWMKFDEKMSHSWTCSRLGDARVFADERIAADYVNHFHKDTDPPWVVRELLVTPTEEDA